MLFDGCWLMKFFKYSVELLWSDFISRISDVGIEMNKKLNFDPQNTNFFGNWNLYLKLKCSLFVMLATIRVNMSALFPPE